MKRSSKFTPEMRERALRLAGGRAAVCFVWSRLQARRMTRRKFVAVGAALGLRAVAPSAQTGGQLRKIVFQVHMAEGKSKFNYAFYATPELALRSNRGILPARVNSALAHKHMKSIAKALAVTSLVLGTLGMAMGFIYLAATSMADITAGTSGFMAGAILFGSGVIAISIISANE